ncbi:MAG: hypothetical protein SF162_01170 [bacterium]|nr:hypothetical protein [bacterium]
MAITPFMKRFRDLADRHLILKQHFPCFAHDLGTFGVLFNPFVPSSEVGTLLGVRAGGNISISIGRIADVAAALALRLLTAACAHTEQSRLSPCQCERQRDQDAIIGIHRVEIRRVGKAHRNPELVQLVDGTQCFGIIAPESVCALDDHMRELANTRVSEQPLITSSVGCFARQNIDVLIDHW